MSVMRQLRHRFVAMLAIDGACFLIAALAIVGYFGAHVAFLGPVAIAAIVLGLLAQVWFIVALARSGADRKA